MPPAATKILVLVSMFASGERGGVTALHLDPATGALEARHVEHGIHQPFFLALHPRADVLYATAAADFGAGPAERVGAWRIADREGRLEPLGEESTQGSGTCYVVADASGQTLLLANYMSGSVASLPLVGEGKLGAIRSLVAHVGSSVNPARQQEPHAHAILPSPDNRWVYAADLGTDQILCYRLDPAAASLEPHPAGTAASAPGSGPRHLVFAPGGRRLYAVNELANTVSAFDYDPDSGRLQLQQTIPTLPPDFAGESYTADVKISPDGRFLYGTNRGHNSLAVYRIDEGGRLELVEIVPSLGAGPQNLAITADGELLLCANMAGDNLAVFRRDADSGKLAPAGEPFAVASPSCIMLVP